MISVIITTYNRSEYLKQAIQGVLLQSYDDLEIIVVDDNSSDDTSKVVSELMKKSDKISYHKNDKNMGPSESRRIGLVSSKGDYIVFHDDDDYYTNPLFFKKVMEIYKKYAELSFVSANVAILNSESGSVWHKKLGMNGYIDKKTYISSFQTRIEKPQSTFSTVFKKQSLVRAGILNSKMINDSSIYLYALLVGDAYILTDFIGRYRVHPNNISKSLSSQFIIDNLKEKLAVYKRACVLNLISDPKKWLAEEYYLTYKYYSGNTSNKAELRTVQKWCMDNDPYHEINNMITVKRPWKRYATRVITKIILDGICKRYRYVAFLQAYIDKENFGDDMFVISLCKRYPDTIFFCNDYRQHEAFKSVPNLYNCAKGVHKIQNKLPFFDYNKFINLVKQKCDAYIVLGGSIFIQPKTNFKAQINQYVQIANLKTRKCIIGSNFGPYDSQDYLVGMKSALKRYDYVCFRDRYSYLLFNECSNNMRYAPDILFSQKDFCKKKENLVTISVFNVSRNHDSFNCDMCCVITKTAEIVNKYIEKKMNVCLLALCPGQGDSEVANQIKNLVYPDFQKQCKLIEYTGNYLQIQEILKKSSYVIAMRFHGIVYSINYGAPVFPVIYSEKHRRMLTDIKYKGNYCTTSEFCSASFELIDSNRKYVFDSSKLAEDSTMHYSFLDSLFISKNKETIRFSVVMPVYNAEKYLRKSIESVLNQDYHNFELICVNDGSTDNSGSILNQYSKNKHVSVITQKNMSAAIARNNGIKASTGDYILFLDADDTMLGGTLTSYATKILENQPDLVVSQALETKEGSGKESDASWVLKNKFVPNKKIFNKTDYPTGIFLFMGGAPWGKCIKRSLILENNIQFPPISRNEDISFVNMCGYYAKRIAVMYRPTILHITDNVNSLENKGFQKDPFTFWEGSMYFRNVIKDNSDYHLVKRSIDNADLERLYFYYNYSDDEIKEKFREFIKNEVFKVLPFDVDEGYYLNVGAFQMISQIYLG